MHVVYVLGTEDEKSYFGEPGTFTRSDHCCQGTSRYFQPSAWGRSGVFPSSGNGAITFHLSCLVFASRGKKETENLRPRRKKTQAFCESLPRKKGRRLYTQLEFANDFTGFLPPSDEERESSSPFCTPYEHDVSMFAKLIAMKRASEDDKAD